MKKVLLLTLTLTSISMFGVYSWKQYLFGTNPKSLIERGQKLEHNTSESGSIFSSINKSTFTLALHDLKVNTPERIITYDQEHNEAMLKNHDDQQKRYERDAEMFDRLTPDERYRFLADYHQEMSNRYNDALKAQNVDWSDEIH